MSRNSPGREKIMVMCRPLKLRHSRRRGMSACRCLGDENDVEVVEVEEMREEKQEEEEDV